MSIERQPVTSSVPERKARGNFGVRKKLKGHKSTKKSTAKKEDVSDLMTSGNETLTATSSEPSKEVLVAAKDDSSADFWRATGSKAEKSLSKPQKKQQSQKKVVGSDEPQFSEGEVRRRLWKYVIRAREKEAAERRNRMDEAGDEDSAAPQGMGLKSDGDEYEDEPWTLAEDEELARWKLGGHSKEMLDVLTFHESRTWDDLMERLAFLEKQHPKCWAALKILEDQEQEMFERELSAETEYLRAKGLLPTSSDEDADDEMEEDTDDEAEEKSVRESDEDADDEMEDESVEELTE